MNKQLTRGAAFAAVASLGLALTACAGGGTTAADPSGEAPTGVTLTMWHDTADSDALLNLYKAWEAKSGNTIELVDIPPDVFPQTVQQKWATGERPDILEWHGNPQDLLSLNPSENLLDLSNLDFASKLGDLKNLSASADGVTYGVTLGPLSVFGLFYNKSVVEKTGIKLPQSYADLAAACTTLNSAGVTPIYMAGGSGFPPAMLAGFNYMAEYNTDATYSQDVASGDVKVTDPSGPFMAGLNEFTTLRDDGCFNSDATTATFENGLKAVLDGTAAFTALPSDMQSLLVADANGDAGAVDSAVGFTAVSATKAVGNFSPSPSGTYYVPKNADDTKQRAAIDFINFVSGEGYQSYVDEAGIIPTLDGATTPKLSALQQDIQNVLKTSTLTFQSAIPGFGPFGGETDKLLAGQSSPQDVADTMQQYVDQARAALGQ